MVYCKEVIRVVGTLGDILADMSGLVPPTDANPPKPRDKYLTTLLMTSYEDKQRTTTSKILPDTESPRL